MRIFFAGEGASVNSKAWASGVALPVKPARFGLLYYKTGNIGDEIQSVAARQYLPRVDANLDRDDLRRVKSAVEIRAILNGWFSPKPDNWPPSADIRPLFVSFHVSETALSQFVSPESITYLRRYEPIGCRDKFTQRVLEDMGVRAYFSGCLTLTLKAATSGRGDQVVIADLDPHAEQLLPSKLRAQALYTDHSSYPGFVRKAARAIRKIPAVRSTLKTLRLSQAVRATLGEIQNKGTKFRRAEALLETYSSARLVITSRLHCALPCLAFGTPVLFVHRNLKDPRFDGLLDYLRCYSVDDLNNGQRKLPWEEAPPNPGDIAHLQRDLRTRCNAFVTE